jgi:hypothetical protein
VPELQGHVKLKLRCAIMTPIESGLLRGLYFAPSICPTTTYIHVFVQPLYLPQDTLVLTAGHRLKHGITDSWDNLDDATVKVALAEAVRSDAMMFLHSVGNLTGLVSFYERALHRRNSHIREGLAYALIIKGEYDTARAQLVAVAEDVAHDGRNTQWQAEQLQRAALMLSLLDQGPSFALAQLADWEAYTRKNLGLEA